MIRHGTYEVNFQLNRHYLSLIIESLQKLRNPRTLTPFFENTFLFRGHDSDIESHCTEACPFASLTLHFIGELERVGTASTSKIEPVEAAIFQQIESVIFKELRCNLRKGSNDLNSFAWIVVESLMMFCRSSGRFYQILWNSVIRNRVFAKSLEECVYDKSC